MHKYMLAILFERNHFTGQAEKQEFAMISKHDKLAGDMLELFFNRLIACNRTP